MTGRPSKLTPELLDMLDRNADDYWSIEDAVATLGITRSVFQRWKAQGVKDEEAGIEVDPDLSYADDPDFEATRFVHFLHIATRVGGPKRRKLAISALQQCLMDPEATHAEKSNAAATILRLDSSAKVEVTGADGGPLKMAVDEWGESIRKMIENRGKM